MNTKWLSNDARAVLPSLAHRRILKIRSLLPHRMPKSVILFLSTSCTARLLRILLDFPLTVFNQVSLLNHISGFLYVSVTYRKRAKIFDTLKTKTASSLRQADSLFNLVPERQNHWDWHREYGEISLVSGVLANLFFFACYLQSCWNEHRVKRF